MYIETQSENKALTNWNDSINEILDDYSELDDNFLLLKENIYHLLQIANSTRANYFSNGNLRDVFYASVPLGFCLWQHLSAVERLLDNQNWCKENPDILELILKRDVGIGLALTHLAKEISPLTAEEVEGEYILNGVAPWASGKDIFDYFLLGFRSSDQNIIAIVDSDTIFASNNTDVDLLDLNAFMSLQTCSIKFQNVRISKKNIISSSDLKRNSKTYQTTYVIPELGVVRRILDELRSLAFDNRIREEEVTQAINRLEKEYFTLEGLNLLAVDLLYRKDKLIRDCTSLFVLLSGGVSMNSKSLAGVLYKQNMLFDIFLQPNALKSQKIREFCQ